MKKTKISIYRRALRNAKKGKFDWRTLRHLTISQRAMLAAEISQ